MNNHNENRIERELPTIVQEEVCTIIMDMHTLLGITAKRAQGAGAAKEKTDQAFELSTIMVSKLLTVLNIDTDIVNKVLVTKLGDLQKEMGSEESKNAFLEATANILGADNDASS